MTMGQRILAARTAAGLSQRELAGEEITRNMRTFANAAAKQRRARAEPAGTGNLWKLIMLKN